MPALTFKIAATDGPARAGTITTPHGQIQTPALVAVGTQAEVRFASAADLVALRAPAIMANTYHLLVLDRVEAIAAAGGLNAYMNWPGPTLTDSGGFQVFSLGWGLQHGVGKIGNIFPDESGERPEEGGKERLLVVDDDGVAIRSHLDGQELRLSPESSIALQQRIGADIILAFDECTSPLVVAPRPTVSVPRSVVGPPGRIPGRSRPTVTVPPARNCPARSCVSFGLPIGVKPCTGPRSIICALTSA